MYIKFVLFMLGFAMIAFGIGFCAGMIADCEENEHKTINKAEDDKC